MEFFRCELDYRPDISINYFSSRAIVHLVDLSELNFKNVTLGYAKEAALYYAEAMQGNATLRGEVATSRLMRNYWAGEQDRWQKAILQANQEDFARLAWELNTDASRFFKRSYESSEMVNLGFVLFGLAETLAPA